MPTQLPALLLPCRGLLQVLTRNFLRRYNSLDYELLDYTDYVKRLDLYPDGSSPFVQEYSPLKAHDPTHQSISPELQSTP